MYETPLLFPPLVRQGGTEDTRDMTRDDDWTGYGQGSC